jgi:GNAT superfamily N-acetyltransferase
MKIRAARREETEALGVIAHNAKAEWGYAPEVLEAWADDLQPTVESLDENPTFVAELDAADRGKIAGFYQVSMEGSAASLEHLWIHPSYWRRGIGRALFEHATQILRDAGVAVLEIDPEPNAVPFYLACGAVRVGEVPAPIPGEPGRVRPQLRLAIGR